MLYVWQKRCVWISFNEPMNGKDRSWKLDFCFFRCTAQQCKEWDGDGSILFDKSCWCTKYGRLIFIFGLEGVSQSTQLDCDILFLRYKWEKRLRTVEGQEGEEETRSRLSYETRTTSTGEAGKIACIRIAKFTSDKTPLLAPSGALIAIPTY